MQVVERLYGLLEVHSSRQGETRAAGKAILETLGVRAQECLKPYVVSSQIIRNIDAHQTQLINRTRRGQLLLAGQTLYLLSRSISRHCILPPADPVWDCIKCGKGSAS